MHQIVDELPEASVEVAGQLLRRAAEEPEVAQLLMAPWDDEPVTDPEQAAVREALKEPGIPLERVRTAVADRCPPGGGEDAEAVAASGTRAPSERDCCPSHRRRPPTPGSSW